METVSENEDLLLPEADKKSATDTETDDLNMWLYIKDKFNLSNKAWDELAQKTSEAQNLYTFIKHMKQLNQKWDVKPTPGEKEGIQVSFNKTILERIRELKRKKVIKGGETIKVKLSGDGTNIGKRIKVVNITFTILNVRKIAMSEKGNNILAIIRMKVR